MRICLGRRRRTAASRWTAASGAKAALARPVYLAVSQDTAAQVGPRMRRAGWRRRCSCVQNELYGAPLIHLHCELFQEELKSDPQPFAFQVLQSTQCRIARARSPARSSFTHPPTRVRRAGAAADHAGHTPACPEGFPPFGGVVVSNQGYAAPGQQRGNYIRRG